MYEHKKQPLASRATFFKRIAWNVMLASGILAICLAIGVAGYHYIAGASWLDAFHNASMILSGMGPVIEITNDAGKWFSSFYALFSGVVFITNIGLLLAPAVHRLLHSLHVEQK